MNLIPSGDVVSIPWYKREADYEAMLLLVPFHETEDFIDYAKWVKGIEVSEQDYRTRKITPFRVNIEIEAVKAWVESNDLTLSHTTIALYAKRQLAAYTIEALQLLKRQDL